MDLSYSHLPRNCGHLSELQVSCRTNIIGTLDVSSVHLCFSMHKFMIIDMTWYKKYKHIDLSVSWNLTILITKPSLQYQVSSSRREKKLFDHFSCSDDVINIFLLLKLSMYEHDRVRNERVRVHHAPFDEYCSFVNHIHYYFSPKYPTKEITWSNTFFFYLTVKKATRRPTALGHHRGTW